MYGVHDSCVGYPAHISDLCSKEMKQEPSTMRVRKEPAPMRKV